MKKENFSAGKIEGYSFTGGPEKNETLYFDNKVPGLGLRVTPAGKKSFIFQGRVRGSRQAIRIAIGDRRTWSLSAAQKEATRLKVMFDQGIDPRQVRAEAIVAKAEAATALATKESREIVTVGMAWEVYKAARKPKWSDRHYADHIKVMSPGGGVRKRSQDLTKPGVLAQFTNVRLVDLTPESIVAWADIEGAERAGVARLGLRLFKAFLTWCEESPHYKMIITKNPAKGKAAREPLGKAKTFETALQREQLAGWFAAARGYPNIVISGYLQAVLLTGSRASAINAMLWEDVNFQWNSLTIRDKVEGIRTIPLPPYLSQVLAGLPRKNEFVFSSLQAESGHIVDVGDAHHKICAAAGIDSGLDIQGLRRSFASLSEWINTPDGIAGQIQGHKPSGVREKHYIRRPLDILRMWHVQIEAWMLNEAGIKFTPTTAGLRAVK